MCYVCEFSRDPLSNLVHVRCSNGRERDYEPDVYPCDTCEILQAIQNSKKNAERNKALTDKVHCLLPKPPNEFFEFLEVNDGVAVFSIDKGMFEQRDFEFNKDEIKQAIVYLQAVHDAI